MSAYMGGVRGDRATFVTRNGGARGGVESRLWGFSGGGVRTHVYEKDGVPYLTIELFTYQGSGREGTVYDGPIAKAPLKRS